MSTNRVNPSNAPLTLTKIPPATTLFGTLSIQRKAASTRNKTIDALTEGDVATVVYRYLHTKSYEKSTALQTIALTCLEALDIVSLRGLMLSSPLQMIPNLLGIWLISVTNEAGDRFCETAEACEDWLIERLGKEKFERLRTLSCDRVGLFAATQVVHECGEPVGYLSQKSRQLAIRARW